MKILNENIDINTRAWSVFKFFNWNYTLIILALQIIGLINLYSAAHSTEHLSRVFHAQVYWILIGWLVFYLVYRLQYQVFLNHAATLYGLNLMALILVLFVGKRIYGSRRWLDLVVFNYQPSETMKFFLVLFMASYLGRRKLENFGLMDLIAPLFILIVPFLVTAKQPDLGTALLLMAIPSSMILFLKVRKKILIGLLALAVLFGYGTWDRFLKPYQKDRVKSFLNPNQDPQGAGYNSIQAKIAIGSGKFFGRGFQKGSQNQLQFLPERHSDFIFCVLSEEYGLLGGSLTLICFLILLFMILNIGQNSKDRKGALVCVGTTAFMFWHIFTNVGMVTGLLPIVGVPLPLLSYGGSSMVTFMATLGLVASVERRSYLF